MRKTIPSLFLILIIVGSLFPLLPVYAEDPEPSGAWDNRYSYKLDYGNGTYTSTFSLGPQVFWNGLGWQELKFEDLGNGYLLENSLITAYVYDWYTVFYDPDNQRVAVDDERWIVEVYNEKKDSWREVDLYAPSLSYSNNATHLTVTRNFDCAEGVFNVTYVLWQGSRLKHDVSFKSGIEENQQFRVIMKLTGIYSDKVKHSTGEETITSEKHIVSPFFVFGEDDNNLVFSEYLWKLGETNETTGEWLPTTLKDVVLDTSARGSKMDIVIGDYTLAEGESLLIDPVSDTWTSGANSDDAMEVVSSGAMYPYENYLYFGNMLVPRHTGMRFVGVTIPADSSITLAEITFIPTSKDIGAVYWKWYGHKIADAPTFSGSNYDISGRARTTAFVDENPPVDWASGVAVDSADIKSIIEELVSSDNSWVSGNDLAILAIYQSGNGERISKAYDIGSDYPVLEVTWEEAGGAEYYETASQTLSWAGSTSRAWILSRTFSQELTFSGSSSRTWDLSRTLSQTIIFTADALVDLIQFFERTASLALSLVSDSSREWSLKRVLSQGFTMTLNANRAYTATRGGTQSLTTAISVGRTWDLSRTATQAITFTSNVLVDLLSLIQRTASLAVSLVSDSGREWSLKRVFSQGLTLVSNGERVLEAFRTASQSLTTSMSANRVFSAIRGVSQVLTTTMNANRYFTAVRTASQTLTTTLNANRGFSAIRDVSQDLTATINTDRLWSTSREASQAMSTILNANRAFTAVRTAFQSLTASMSVDRTWDLKRILSQSLSFISSVQAQLHEGYTYFHRYVSVGLSLAMDSIRIWDSYRTASQTITFASSALGDLLEFFSRSVSLTLNFVSSVIARTQMWLLSLFVTDFDDIPLENATVALTRNNSEVTSYWKTYANGSIPDQLLSPDDYFLMISKYNYLTNETWVSLTGNYTLGIIMEGAWIETNPEILGLFGVCLILQLCYAYGLYKGTQPTLTLTAGVLTALSWYTTGQVVLSFNQVQGVPIALLLSGFSTVNVVLLFRIVYALMMHYQEA